MVAFDRPIGAGPDTKELEYISALHQTGAKVRPNGSIKDEDIQLYLKSRFGIVVTLEQIRSTILHGFAGGDEGTLDATEVIDMMELTAIILIPLLLKASIVEGDGKTLPEGVLPPPENLLRDVVEMIVHDSGAAAKDGVTPVTADLIKRIFLIYGERDMAKDEELIHEMIDACRDDAGDHGQVAFAPRSFGLALTRDVTLFDLTNETKASTTIEDVFGHARIGDSPAAPTPKLRTTAHDASGGEPNPRPPPDRCHTESTSRPPVDGGHSEVLSHLGCDDAPQDAVVDVSNKGSETNANKGQEICDIKRVYTAPAIDIQAGTYRSKKLIVSLWGSVLFLLVRYAEERGGNDVSCAELYVPEGSVAENMAGIGCDTTISIVTWLIRFLLFCGLGMLFIGMGGLGNFVGNTRWCLSFIGMVSAFIVGYHEWIIFGVEENPVWLYLQVMTILFSTFAMYCHFTQIVMIIFNSYGFAKSKYWDLLGFTSLRQELQVKKAAAFKLNQLAVNARSIHYRESSASAFKTYFGHALSSYALHGTEYIRAGGLFWFWRKFRDGTILQEEGLWYSARLVAANMSQYFVPILIILMGNSAVQTVIANYEPNNSKEQMALVVNNTINNAIANIGHNEKIQQGLDMISSVMNATNMTGIFNCSAQASIETKCVFDQTAGDYLCGNIESAYDALCALVTNPDLHLADGDLWQALINKAYTVMEPVVAKITAQGVKYLDSAASSLYPEDLYMLTVPLGFAIGVAVLQATKLGLFYIPSVTTTLIQLRTGVIPSLGDHNFEKYRVLPDTVTFLTGMMFWGCIVSSLLVGLGTGLVLFLLFWQVTRALMQKLIVMFIGVFIITAIKMLLVTSCKYCFFKGLYRTRPAGANISMLALEWANYVLSTAFVLVRMCKLIIVAAASIGVIDRPFLALGVGQIGTFEFDSYPTIHTRDLVAHEAHRHPYIEILGHIYLMKLRYSDSFGNRAGSAWRLIFVYALMPWFHKYRINDGDYGKNRDKDGDGVVDVNGDIEESANELPAKKTNSSLVFRAPDLKHVGVEMLEAHNDSSENDRDQAMREMEADNIRLIFEVEHLKFQLKRIREKKEY